MVTDFSDAERRGVYRAIYERRDVRSQFLPDPVPDELLLRILDAAHHAPSVGFMQPWDFLVIRDRAIRQAVYENFAAANRRAAEAYSDERRKLYDNLKLAGIVDAPVNICVTCDHARPKGNGLGRQTDPAVDLYSAVCAVQNLWLAARAESVGVGWVSILDLDQLKATLGIPPDRTLVAYLCLGYVSEFRPQPDLEEKGWETRSTLLSVTHFDHWGSARPMNPPALMILGTASTWAKSLVTAGLGRIFSDSGIRVAPFKAQNMSLNSAATPDGREIGRAQALQAEACRVTPTAEMNPILIKPSSDTGAQVVLLGRVWGQVTASDYHQRRVEELLSHRARELPRARHARHGLMLLEGAGSPAEINLREHDIVNMRHGPRGQRRVFAGWRYRSRRRVRFAARHARVA